MSRFPTVTWGQRQATFLPADTPLPDDLAVAAALVFAWHETGWMVADIAGRGWCVPSGRLEPGETAEQAARREAWEEAGITLHTLRLGGHFLLTAPEGKEAYLAAAFVGEVEEQAELPIGTESQGVRLLTPQELPAHYYLWDPLIEAVFTFAEEAVIPDH